MAWTVEQLREYRQYPQSDAVIAHALRLAEADVDGVNPSLATGDAEALARRDRAIEQIVRIDLGPEAEGKDGPTIVQDSKKARAEVLNTVAPLITTIRDTRRNRGGYPPRYI